LSLAIDVSESCTARRRGSKKPNELAGVLHTHPSVLIAVLFSPHQALDHATTGTGRNGDAPDHWFGKGMRRSLCRAERPG
jgi:hypothetical protein